MKKTFLAIALFSAASFTASANNISFSAVDDKLETKACITAATDGLAAVKELVSEQGRSFQQFKQSVTCNGQSLVTFARTYREQSKNQGESVVLNVVAQNNNFESKVCVSALTDGLRQTLAKYKVSQSDILCNGQPLASFVRDHKKASMVASNGN